MLNLKYISTDNGFCRAYYKAKERPGKLYCMQLASNRTKDYELLSCSSDGEPSCPIKPGFVASIEMPAGDDATDRELRAYLDRTPATDIRGDLTNGY